MRAPTSTKEAAVGMAGWAERELYLCWLGQVAVVSTQLKSVPPADGACQTDLQWEHAATQLPGCGLCPTPIPAVSVSSKHICGRGTPTLGVRAQEDGSRMRSIKEFKGETIGTASYLPLGQQADRMHNREDLLSFVCLAELRD